LFGKRNLKSKSMEQKKICIGGDHAGYHLKEQVKLQLLSMAYEVMDYGTFSETSVDYPDFIHPLAEAITKGEFSRGIIMCGSGNGVNMTANKHAGIRSALCWTIDLVSMARQHNDANILALPARYIDEKLALEMVKVFLDTPFEGGRHKVRIDKINIPE
jgi:ribose 5-phosphate isomerase B